METEKCSAQERWEVVKWTSIILLLAMAISAFSRLLDPPLPLEIIVHVIPSVR